MIMRFTAYIDGSCLSVGYPTRTAASAAILLAIDDRGTVIKSKRIVAPVPGIQEHNRAELYAAIIALQAFSDTKATITIYTDSDYVITSAHGKAPKHNRDLYQMLIAEIARHKVMWKHCKGHAGNYWNQRVDYLAKRTARKLQEVSHES